METDKRRAVRVREELTLTVSYVAGNGERKVMHMLSRDISTTGMQMRTPDFVPVGTRLQIKAVLERPRRMVEIVGVVRWIREAAGVSMYEAGVEFENLMPEAVSLLKEYVERKIAVEKEDSHQSNSSK